MVRTRKIGKSGIEASAVTFGTMGVGGGPRFPGTDDAESIRAIHAALDRGITSFDSAPVYGFGHSEEVLGTALKGRRDEAVIATKCGLWWGDDVGSFAFSWEGKDVKRNLSPRTIRLELEESLKRLQTDYIDIYYTHNPSVPPYLTPIDETISALLELRDEGKIRAIGASNCTPSDVLPYIKADAIEIVQGQFNVVQRDAEAEMLPLVTENGLSFHAYSPLARGLLTGAFGPTYIPDPNESRAANKLWSRELYPLAMKFMAEFARVANDLGVSTTTLSIASLLSLSDSMNVICGVRRPDRLDEIVDAAGLQLSDEVSKQVWALSDDFEASRVRSARAGA